MELLQRTRPCGDPARALDEVRTIATVFDQTLIRAVPRLYRVTGARWSVMPAARRPKSGTSIHPVRLWVGGDRDGNPFVTADVTRRAMGVQVEHTLQALEVSVDGWAAR